MTMDDSSRTDRMVALMSGICTSHLFVPAGKLVVPFLDTGVAQLPNFSESEDNSSSSSCRMR
jgi:hypothetical protein